MAEMSGERLHPDIPSQAAAYAFYITANHAFVDGNKRTAAASVAVFLVANDCSPVNFLQLRDLVVGISDGTIHKAEAIQWFRDRSA